MVFLSSLALNFSNVLCIMGMCRVLYTSAPSIFCKYDGNKQDTKAYAY